MMQPMLAVSILLGFLSNFTHAFHSLPIQRVASRQVPLSSLHAFPSSLAIATSMDMSDMPPPFVPVIASLAILAGVGVLQASLGDVLSSEVKPKSKINVWGIV
jgi:hypothetical protein